MFISESLNNYLNTSGTIKTESVIFAEWNMNDPENIKKLGNYRYRPSYTESPYFLIPSTYDDFDLGNYYTGATDSDTVIESGLNEEDEPTIFLSSKEKMKMLFSLEDCVKPNRPRSGINKVLYLNNSGSSPSGAQFIDDSRSNIARRPRYYMASKDDQFKYWTSYRTELGVQTPIPNANYSSDNSEVSRGVSFFHSTTSRNYIEDAAPFVVYNDAVPSNKIVVKMQTNVGEESLGSLRYNDSSNIQDPLYGDANKTTPIIWRVEVLKNGTWMPAISFDESSTRQDGAPVVNADGYVEVSYGLNVPEKYLSTFRFAGEMPNEQLLPETNNTGLAYLIKSSSTSRGSLYINDNGEWQTFVPNYQWSLSEEGVTITTRSVTKISDPDYFIENNQIVFREFDFIDGIRVVVQTMNRANCTFDLIEMSPRLFVDITDRVSEYSVKKTLADLGNSSVPVGSIYPSSGSINMIDYDLSFHENNVFNFEKLKGSIVSKYLDKKIKFLFYEGVYDDNNIYYYLPIKTMYSVESIQVDSKESSVSIQTKDFFYFLEESQAPQLLLTDVSLSYAMVILLDFIGFDNYVFKRLSENEIIIPYFFVEPGQNVAEVLKSLAMASQTAMFFDEYNNLVVMSKEYLLPEKGQRDVNISLRGSEEALMDSGESYQITGYIYDQEELADEEYGAYVKHPERSVWVYDQQSSSWVNAGIAQKIYQPNIVSFSSIDKKVFNNGRIDYTTRYIQRSVGSTESALNTDEYKNYVYKPVLLWEASGNPNRQTINELSSNSGAYVLGAVPLNSDLTEEAPYSDNNVIFNNIIDFGENVYWMTKYQGYFYANGEVIRYDAMEYSISGVPAPVWISNNEQYQSYFSSLRFNGKMYPTGRVRIYTNPEFDMVSGQLLIKDAQPIKENGRSQFGTQITKHSAGFGPDAHWNNVENIYGCVQEASSYLFNLSEIINYPTPLLEQECGKETLIGSSYINSDLLARESSVSSIIKNFLTNRNVTENEESYKKTTKPGSVQASALVVNGPEVPQVLAPANFISYIYRDFLNEDGSSTPYKHYGTRMRIVGKVEYGTNKSQTPIGRFPVYNGGVDEDNEAPSSSVNENDQEIIIHGGSGGIAFNVDKSKNTGYYFEIVALTADNIEQYANTNTSTQISSNIVLSTPATASGTEVTVWLENETDVEVGQSVVISGLSDVASGNPEDLSTPMNGEYLIKSVGDNRKTLVYGIGTTLNTTSQNAGKMTFNEGRSNGIANVIFYKTVADEEGRAIPYRLWSGLSLINVDSGDFYGQSRLLGEENTTVYDLAAEYINVGSSRRFFLYINNKQVAVVDDPRPLQERNSLALFVRGGSKCMFDNVYALSNNYSQNSNFSIQDGISQAFGDNEVTASESLRKYSISGLVQETYLSGISSLEGPKSKIYFEEFGTIFREAAYFNVLYDRAYPALYAKLMKPINNIKGYTTSGFYAWSYGAEFLIFNATDFALALDDTSGSFLRIFGTAFTQNTTYSLTVDDLYKKRSNLIDSALGKPDILFNPLTVQQEYNRIKSSRDRYGNNEISIQSPYIQTSDAAENIFGWVIDKVSKPRKMIGLEVLGTENVQLGDLVNVRYLNKEGVDIVSKNDVDYVVYQIDFSRKNNGPETIIYLAEV